MDVQVQDGGDVERLVAAIRTLLDTLPNQPDRIHMRSGEASVELAWPHGNGGRAVAPVPAAHETAPRGGGEPEEPVRHIVAPSVGTFYRAPEPGARPFVSEGDPVRPGQQVAIVEAMKLMLPVEADQPGRVRKVLKRDGEPVEYGEPLIELAAAEDG